MKVSDEELKFITGEKGIEEAIASLFVGDVQGVIYTKGDINHMKGDECINFKRLHKSFQYI